MHQKVNYLGMNSTYPIVYRKKLQKQLEAGVRIFPSRYLFGRTIMFQMPINTNINSYK